MFWWLGLGLCAVQPPQFTEKVEVRQVVLQVRVLAADGQPVLGLTERNFRVLADGQEVPHISARFVDTTLKERPAGAAAAPPGRLIAILVQRDLQRARVSGLLAYKGWAARLVENLPPEDRVALLVQDSRLHLYSDWTTDHRRVAELLRTQLFRPPPRPIPGTESPTLGELLPESVQREASTHEKGLLAVARALSRLPGDRTLVVLGWGLGRFSYPGFYLPGEYFQAVRLLEDAHVQVFSLDITDADSHTLELGLIQVAEDTGGLYAKTHLFPEQVTRRLLGALAGYYELTFPRPPLPEGVHQVEVELVGTEGTVLCRRTFADSPPGLP